MNTNDLTTCANCGKGEEAAGELKACTACKMVKYCNRDCQIAHRPQHKKACKKRAAELHDEQLFKQPPPNEDCPICMLPLPTLLSGSQYSACCGKRMCCGCIHAMENRAFKKFVEGNITAGIRDIDEQKCAFCRTPEPRSDKEGINQIKKRVKANDTSAIQYLGTCFYNGTDGLPQDRAKGLELWHQAAELGCAKAYLCIGAAYCNGDGVERDFKKANYYNLEAAMRGDIRARYSLGACERNAGNYDRALKHYMIAIRGGDKFSLNMVKEMFMEGGATKEDYSDALRAFQSYLDEIKSPQRDEAAAFGDGYKYY